MSRYDELFGAPFNSAEGGYSAPLAGEPGVDYSSPYSGATDLYDPSDLDLKIDPVSIALTIAGMVGNYWMNERNNDRNEALQREAHERNVELWRMQTAYNTPAAQMARLKAAGLNPNLMYGSPQNTASAAPEKKVSERKAFQFDPLTMINAMQVAKQMEASDADIEYKHAAARDLNATAQGKEIENTDKADAIQRTKEEHQTNIKNLLSLIDLRDNYEKPLINSKWMSQELQNLLDATIFDDKVLMSQLQLENKREETKNLIAATKHLYEQISYLKKRGELIDLQKVTEIFNWSLKESQSSLNFTQSELNTVLSTLNKGKKGFYQGHLMEKYIQGNLSKQEEMELKAYLQGELFETMKGSGSDKLKLATFLFNYVLSTLF